MRPTDKCPFIEKFDDHNPRFCIGCPQLVRDNEFDDLINHRLAYTCRRDAMAPAVYYADSEL